MAPANEFVRPGPASGVSSLSSGPCEAARLDELVATLGPGGLGQLADLFVRETEGRVLRLRDVVDVTDGAGAAELRGAAHQLWGAAASLGATHMAALADQLRIAAVAGDRSAV